MSMKRKPSKKVGVGERAIIARINRHLKKNRGAILRTCREGTRDFPNLGRFYVVDINHNVVVGENVDLGELARDIGVLKPWEEIVP